MNTLEVLIVVCGVIFSILLTVLVFVLWKFMQKKKENDDEIQAFKNINKIPLANEPNVATTPPITWRVTSPQVPSQEYDPSTLAVNETSQTRRKKKRRRSNLPSVTNLQETKKRSKSLSSLLVTGEPLGVVDTLPVTGEPLSVVNTPPLRRKPRSSSQLSDSGMPMSKKSEKQGQISRKMKDDLYSLRKGKSSLKKKSLGPSWSLNESGHFLPHLSSFEQSDSSEFGENDSDGTSLLDDSMSQGKMRLASRRGSNIKPGTDLKVNGSILLSTEYFTQEKTLIVTLHRATNLGGEHRCESETNSYVRLCLLPDKRQKQQSKVSRGTQDPSFEEQFSFPDLPLNNLEKNKLSMRVFNSCLVKKDELLGESTIFLSSLKHDEKEVFQLDLLAKRSRISASSIRISLCHKGTYSKLEVIIHNIKDLVKTTSGSINPYVRLSVYKNDSIETKETQQLSGERNPSFNESFDFDLMTDVTTPLSTYSLAVTVMHHSVFRKDYALGHVIFTLDSPQPSAEYHLLETESDPHRRVTKWHNLIDPDDI